MTRLVNNLALRVRDVEFSTFSFLFRSISVPSGVCFAFLSRAFSIICMFFNILVS